MMNEESKVSGTNTRFVCLVFKSGKEPDIASGLATLALHQKIV
jgi:hypothetical protein